MEVERFVTMMSDGHGALGTVLVYDKVFETWGIGRDEDEAAADWMTTLRDEYMRLCDLGPERLGPHLRMKLKRLKRYAAEGGF